MQVKSTAAVLRRWNYHLATVVLQHANGGFVQTGKGNVCNTTREESHAIAPLARGRECLPDVRIEERYLGSWRERLDIAKSAHQLENAACAQQPLYARCLVNVEACPQHLKRRARRQHSFKEGLPE